MSMSYVKDSPKSAVSELTKVALVAALYFTVTVVFSVISFGPVQLRLSEMFNYLALFNKRYVIAVTLGVVLANFMSPTWVLDVPVGSAATLIALLICRQLTKKITNNIVKMVITAVIFALSMCTIAAQFTILLGFPFWATWLSMGIGELLSMTVGGMIIYALHKKIDFSK
ncbi:MULTISPECIES: QueT transporter family protein [Sporosarcina]|uniref:QueT transporter family protein n=1 Tax=Sporosarcina TaxID=1569 RepID=UPI00129AF006|nr:MULTISPECIES: QueT transporter family protein [Sporosarcina]GKV64705.1 membrane protein [Sporosarcina sp. NCCP-2331]GLB54815.1 membrane protein [Sporosarcina sp. NCCP-2378]